MIAQARLMQEREDGFLYFVPCINHKDLVRAAGNVLIDIPDPRKISKAQRRKAYVLLSYIAAWWSYTPLEAAKEITKMIFAGQEIFSLKDETFSLSDCSMTTARLYITFLIDFCVLHGIETGEPLYSLCEDIPRYVWACLMNKKCAVCGKKAELHHVDAVGMGRNRKEIIHVGMNVLPLCRLHHTEIHKIGKQSFLKKYLLEPIKMTEEIGEQYNLNKHNLSLE